MTRILPSCDWKWTWEAEMRVDGMERPPDDSLKTLKSLPSSIDIVDLDIVDLDISPSPMTTNQFSSLSELGRNEILRLPATPNQRESVQLFLLRACIEFLHAKKTDTKTSAFKLEGTPWHTGDFWSCAKQLKKTSDRALTLLEFRAPIVDSELINASVSLSLINGTNANAIFPCESKRLSSRGFSGHDPKFMKSVFQAFIQNIVQANFTREVYKAIFRAIVLAVSVRIFIVGTFIVQIKVLLWKKSLRELINSCDKKGIQELQSVSSEITVLSMGDHQAMGPYEFGQGGQDEDFGMEGFEEDGEGQGFWEDRGDMAGAGDVADDMFARIPNFEEVDEEDLFEFGDFAGRHGDADLRRVPSVSDVAAGGNNFFGQGYGQADACANANGGLGEDWVNAVFLDHDVIEMVLEEIDLPEPMAPPIPLPPADEDLFDNGAANAA